MPREARGIHPVADFSDVDAAFAHEAAIIQEIGGGRPPIADVEGMQAPRLTREINLRLQLGVPPHMVHIHRDADCLGRTQCIANLMRLPHRVHRAAIIRIHRVQWLDGQLHARLLRRRQHRRDALGDLLARLHQRLPRHRAAHQHNERSANRVRLLDGF